MKRIYLLFIVFGLLLFVKIFYYAPKMEYINIMVSYSDPYEEYEINTISKIAETDINNYFINENLNYRVNCLVNMIPYSAALNHTIYCRENNIQLIVGHLYSGQCKESLEYVNNNQMIMISPYSSDDGLSIAGDSLYRLSCPDSHQGYILSKMLKSKEKKGILIVYLNISWGEQIKNKLLSEYDVYDSTIFELPYDNNSNFTILANSINDEIIKLKEYYSMNQIGIIFISLVEITEIINNIEKYNDLIGIDCFGTQALSSKLLEPMFKKERSEIYTKVNFYLPRPSTSSSVIYKLVSEKYYRISNQSLGFTEANIYDAIYIYVNSVMNSDSKKMNDIKNEIFNFSKTYIGITGNCSLNENGDRMDNNYDIIKYQIKDGKFMSRIYGCYNYTKKEIEWYEDN